LLRLSGIENCLRLTTVIAVCDAPLRPSHVLTIDPADWLELGLKFVGFDKSRQKCHKTNQERFAMHFGASPETHSLIFSRF
jgi:hypothetical protein